MTLQDAITEAEAAYQELDKAMEASDWRRVGAAMYRLKQALDRIRAVGCPCLPTGTIESDF